jgi:CheY-like chemotaxis protein
VEKSGDRPYDVLVVDDNSDDAELLCRTLRKAQLDAGLEINAQTASTGSQASTQLSEQRFDAIFLDISMPAPDGMELTRQIRHSEMNRTTPIVMVTGADDRGLMTRAFDAGATFFLFKPVDRTRLLRLIQISRAPIERERRRLQRVNVKCKVSIESEQGSFNGETEDLSLNGMFVHSSRVLPAGSIVNVNVALAPASSIRVAARVAARVVRVVGNDSMGFEFERVGKPERERLGAFLVPFIVAVVEKNN